MLSMQNGTSKPPFCPRLSRRLIPFAAAALRAHRFATSSQARCWLHSASAMARRRFGCLRCIPSGARHDGCATSGLRLQPSFHSPWLATPEAEQDLLDIWLYIAEECPTSADRFLERLEEKARKLAEFTKIGADRVDLAPNLKSFPVDCSVLPNQYHRHRTGSYFTRLTRCEPCILILPLNNRLQRLDSITLISTEGFRPPTFTLYQHRISLPLQLRHL